MTTSRSRPGCGRVRKILNGTAKVHEWLAGRQLPALFLVRSLLHAPPRATPGTFRAGASAARMDSGCSASLSCQGLPLRPLSILRACLETPMRRCVISIRDPQSHLRKSAQLRDHDTGNRCSPPLPKEFIRRNPLY